jgi:YidC/Oxa1 family membrane protein insertase
LKWIAQEDKYFFSALVPLTAVEEASAWIHEDSPLISFKGNSDKNKFVLYAGPKDLDHLKKLGVGLEHIVDFGFFSLLSRPLFWILKYFYNFSGNYGWAIVLLTIVTRIPFIPIMNKGQKSMKKLQKIQPKMAEIREKYKKDPKKLQKEMSELYKKSKVNPLGGCLPMLIQLPVFFALYKVLLVAIELRGAPFILWITDLSLKDPYYVLPIVMGLTMVLQQKMTPTAADPKQAKLMMFMPVIFTFMFLQFASGLVLYWLVNNILGIIQQFYVNRKTTTESA